ncbi:ATP-binding protein [Massilia sp. IC2-476]|uniref:PAS domain-containing hybrid sensor histidine kinase/response regulator n=1 Tax=Massilia sp. IC2-476 TaxID=2887199 RepID=UPI001D0FB2F3|nr:ATP-binding protein [Massilia sp. IC2-476]MCC2970784.1 response regulator [Massilia sp. IC2-476]
MLSLDQIQAVFNSSTIPTALFSPSTDPVFVAVNDAFLRTSTRSREELLGMRLFAAFGAPGESVENSSASALRDSIAQAIRTGQPQTMPAQHYPILVRQADGSERFEERYWNAVNAPVFDAAGQLIFILHYTLDITQQVKAQEQHRATTELYSKLIESMDNGFCLVDIMYDEDGKPVDYRFLDINPAFEAQTGLVGARGKYVRELVPGLTDTHWAELYSTVALSGKPLRLVEEPSPLGRWFNIYATRVGDPALGKVAVLFTDVTESRRTRDDLRSLASDLANENRRKTEFLATLAHELRNPLAPLRTGLDLLRMAGATPPPRVHEMMDRQLNQLVHLIDDLLDIARINSGKVQLRRERIALRDVIDSAVETASPLIRAAGHTLDVSVPEAPLVLDADPARLAQVLSNLLTNAAKYTPAGGRISIAVDSDRERVRIAVTDTGIGIPADALPGVFDMFSQVSRNMGRAQGGLGIGLSLVRSLVEMHEGTVRAESAGEGQGSSFIVELPLAAAAPPQAQAPSRADAAAIGAGRSLRILVADDNIDAAKTIKALLQASGHEVDAVHDGRRALELALAAHYDLAILDIGMPGLSGYEVAAALRGSAGRPDIYLAALTGWGSEEDQARARAAGFDAHLTKPASLAELQRLLAALPEGRRA